MSNSDIVDRLLEVQTSFCDSATVQDAAAEIERLRELAEAGKNDRKAIDELVDENLRLRGLLKKSLFFLIVDSRNDDLIDEIEKEVGDE